MTEWMNAKLIQTRDSNVAPVPGGACKKRQASGQSVRLLAQLTAK